MFPLEVPYMNLYVHKDCLDACENVEEFVSKNLFEFLETNKN